MVAEKMYVYTVEDEIATSYVVNIIEEAMTRYSISYGKVVEVLKKLRYWDLFNDTEVTTMGAHEGIEPILSSIKGAL